MLLFGLELASSGKYFVPWADFGNTTFPERPATDPFVLGDVNDDHIGPIRGFRSCVRAGKVGQRIHFLGDRAEGFSVFGEVDPP